MSFTEQQKLTKEINKSQYKKQYEYKYYKCETY